MLEKLIIREATISDCEILNDLFEKLLKYEQNLFDENIKQDLQITSFFNKKFNNVDSIILVATIDNTIVGYIYGSIDGDNKIKKEKEAIINSIYVEEQYRNKKIGTSLINQFINEIVKLKVKYILIDNFINNETARYLYSKLGFSLFKENRRKEITYIE